MAYSLLGAHINSTTSGLPEAIKRWKPPLVVLLDHSDVWHSVKAESPNTTFVGRVYVDSQPDFNAPSLNPSTAARDVCEKILPWAERMGTTYSFWQGVNEPIIESTDAMRRFADFEAERVHIMNDHGFRAVVGSFSVGNPQLPYWQQFLPALEAAHQYQGALALHQYAWPTLDQSWPWYALRHRKVYDGEPAHHWGGFPEHLKSLPLLITECGLDGLIEQGSTPRGWQALYGVDPAEYLSQLDWYSTQLLQDPYVIGAAIYCLATPDPRWKSYDIWPELVNELAEAATPIYRLAEEPSGDPGEPTEPPEPAEPPATGWQMEVDVRPGPRIIAGCLTRAAIQVTVADPWGNATTVVSGSKPEYGPGGFEVLAPHLASYTLTFLDQTFVVQSHDVSTIVTFTESEPPLPPPEEPPEPPPDAPDQPFDEGAMLAIAIEKLDRIIELLSQRF